MIHDGLRQMVTCVVQTLSAHFSFKTKQLKSEVGFSKEKVLLLAGAVGVFVGDLPGNLPGESE